MKSVSRASRLLLGVSALSLTATAAFAQSAPAAPAEPESTAPQTDQTDDDSDVVVVTADRRTQNLQDYAGTAITITGDDLRAVGLQNFNDLDGRIPGLSVSNNQGNLEVYIRGVGSSNNTELGDPAAATHFNGVYVPRPAGFGAAFFDIQRVEVNIGPQGTLRGRNATAGSVDVLPWKPGLGIRNGAFELSAGNYGEISGEAVINLPVTDRSALRVAGYFLERDSYMQNVTPTSRELGLTVPTAESEGVGVAEAADDFGVRVSFLAELTDQWTLTLTGDYLTQQGTGYTGINYANPLGNGIDPDSIDDPRKVFGRGFTPEEDTRHGGLKLHLEYTNSWFNAEFISSYRDLVYDYEFVTPASPAYPGALANLQPVAGTFDNFSRVRFITDSVSKVNELRLFSDPDDRLVWAAGIFHFTEAQRTFLGTTGDRNPFFTGVEFNQTTDTESLSYYADATYSLTDDIRVTAGFRFTSDEKERFGVNARYQFILGGGNFSCCFATGHGTEGFEFAALDRTIFNPDTNGNGALSDQEVLAFFFNGVKQFGRRDGLNKIFANGIIPGDAPAAQHPLCSTFTFTGSCFNTFVPALDGRLSFGVLGGNSIALQNGRLDNDFSDWRLRGELDLSENNLLYALVATGNKSGGFNDNIPGTQGLGTFSPATSAPAAFDVDTLAPTYGPETLTLFEIGSKNEFRIGGQRATLNLSAFYYDYSDMQLTTLLSTAQILNAEGITLTPAQQAQLGGNIVSYTFNAANAEIYGAQIEGSMRFANGIGVKGTLLWLPEARVVDSVQIQDARFQADVDAANAVNRSIEGNRLVRTPEIQFNASISQSWAMDAGTLDGVLSVGYRSEQHMTIFNGRDYANPNNPTGRLNDLVDSYVTVDAGIGFSPRQAFQWRFEAYGANLTNVQQPQAIIITQFDNTRFFNRPTTYGARVRYSF